MADINFYVGPYLKCIFHLTEDIRLERTCINSDCSKHGEHSRLNYCGVCGSQVRDGVEVKVLIPSADKWDFTESIDETLAMVDPEGYMQNRPEKCDLFISNIGGEFCIYEGEDSEDSLMQFDWADSTHLSRAFAIKFNQEIARANGMYDSVVVRFGVMVWRS